MSNETSTDVVPFYDALPEWNRLHGTELEAHNDALSIEDARRINEQFTITIYGGSHAQGHRGNVLDVLSIFSQPLERHYDEAKRVVDTLGPGAVLFLENYGFSQGSLAPNVNEKSTAADDKLVKLERARQSRAISAWDYALELAKSKGIPVVFADQNAFEAESNRALNKDRNPRDLLDSPDPTEKAFGERIVEQRSRKAAYIVKDYALDHLLENSDPATPKRQLVILSGITHLEQIKEAFDKLNLEATPVLLNVATHEEVIKENGEDLVKALGVVISRLLSE